MQMKHNHPEDPLQPHRHDPNPTPPPGDSAITVTLPDHSQQIVSLADLQQMPLTTVHNCYIVSTGHGTSGPFAFSGVTLRQLLATVLPPQVNWSQVEVISADGFGNRILADELAPADSADPDAAGPILLSYMVDNAMLSREAGLVRLIVPQEKDDALRQVKWVSRINVLA